MVARVCLNMIVKNESRVVRRCLASVKPWIDSWVIVDTGSSDGTQDVIRSELAGIPGELHERPWVDFGHNRSEALELARASGAEYAFIIDADEELSVPPGFSWPPLEADGYLTLHTSVNNSFYRMQLLRLALPWRYEGVLHEYATCPGARPAERLEGPVTHGYFDSARNVDPRRKYEQDARVLEQALQADPGNRRYVFYLAQSYRDSGQNEAAERWYRKRADMSGWDEEVWYSLYQIGLMRERLQRPSSEVVDAHLAAFQFRPSRAEPLVALARYFRGRDELARGYVFAKAAVGIPLPSDILFVDRAAYEWRALDEYSIAAYWAGHYSESLQASEQLLASGRVPEAQRARVESNRRFAIQKLSSCAAAGSAVSAA